MHSLRGEVWRVARSYFSYRNYLMFMRKDMVIMCDQVTIEEINYNQNIMLDVNFISLAWNCLICDVRVDWNYGTRNNSQRICYGLEMTGKYTTTKIHHALRPQDHYTSPPPYFAPPPPQPPPLRRKRNESSGHALLYRNYFALFYSFYSINEIFTTYNMHFYSIRDWFLFLLLSHG